MTSTPPPEPAPEIQPVHNPRGMVHYPPPFLPGPLPCPRCISTDTKFCYYNNYNLSQPRHFCKTCRRHWTHGGVLRDVPVGGGSRIKKPRPRKNRSSSSYASTSTCSLTHEYDDTPPFSEVSASDKRVNRNDVIEPMKNIIGDGGFLSLMNSLQDYGYGSTLFSGGYVSGYGSGLANGFLQGFGTAAAVVWDFHPQQAVGDIASRVNSHAFGAFASANGGGGAPAAAPSGVDTWQMGGAYHESQGGLNNGTGNDCYAWPELQMSSSNSVPVVGGVNEKVV